jgi:hypothetical protein
MKLISHHLYKIKNPKAGRYIDTIYPQADREVSKAMFDSYEDTTPQCGIRIVEVHGENVLRDILRSTGEEQ